MDDEWLTELINNPTREKALELASLYREVREAYEALSAEYEEHIDDDIKEAEETLILFEKAARTIQERKLQHKHATSALDAIRAGLGIEKGSIKEVAEEVAGFFAPRSKIDKRIGELIDEMLNMQARKGKVDILTRLVSIQKIKLCARGELTEKKRC